MDLAQQFLTRAMTADGGWGYRVGGASFTEPTALGLIALASGQSASAVEPALKWLLESQRRDGGWGALRGDSESSWQTSVAVWALGVLQRTGSAGQVGPALDRGSGWLLANRSRSLALPNPATRLEGRLTGWPWTAGTFGWVIPTGLALIGLRAAGRASASSPAVSEAVGLLKDRRCSEGGWNWGNPVLFGTNLPPYATETAIASIGLLAAGEDPAGPEIRGALDWLGRNLDPATGITATAWGLLALRAGGRQDEALRARLLAAQAADGGWRSSAHATALSMLALGDARAVLAAPA